MHDIGDMLLRAGFTNPVVDTEYLTIEYASYRELITDCKLAGCGKAINGLASFSARRQAYAKLQQWSAQPVKLTLEIFVAHGWKDKPHLELAPGQSVITFNPRKKNTT
jgi:malonyl-CoA O-methyltransferase